MKPHMDYLQLRRGLLIGAVYALILNGLSYAVALRGSPFPSNLGMLLAMGFYFAMGWWAAGDAMTKTEGVSRGGSMGLGIGLSSYAVSLLLMAVILGAKIPTDRWVIFVVAGAFGELKWAAVALVGGSIRGGRTAASITGTKNPLQ